VAFGHNTSDCWDWWAERVAEASRLHPQPINGVF